MNEHRDRLARRLLLAVLFLLPWQTRYILAMPTVGGAAWQYGVISVYATEVLILLAVSLLGWERVMQGIAAWKWPLAAVVLSIVFAQMPWLGAVYAFHAACAALLVRGAIVSGLSTSRAVTAFAAGLVPAVVLGWWQTVVGSNPAVSWLGLAARDASQAGVAVVETAAGRLMRAYGPLPHPNIFGGFAAVALLAATRLASSPQTPSSTGGGVFRALPFGLLSIAGSALALSFSRSAAIGAVLAVAWLLWRLRKQAVPAIAAACVGVALTVIPFAPSFAARVDAANRLERTSVTERVSQLKEWATVFLTNPVTGVGPGNYTAVLVVRDPSVPAWASQPVHNAFLLMLAELGFVGVFAFLSVLIPKTWNAWRQAGEEGRTWGIAFALVLLPIAFFDHYLWSLWPGMSLVTAAWVLRRPTKT